MKLVPLSFLFLFFLSSCAMTRASKAEKHQMELSLHKARTEIEEIKHDLNTYEIHCHILEGKFIDQEQTIASLRELISELKQGKIEDVASKLQNVDKSIAQLRKQQEKIVSDIRQLSSHANDTTTALSQYQEKISQFEKSMALQRDQMQEIVRLKEGISKLTEGVSTHSYVVQPGDSLEKIARKCGTSVETLKTLNQLSSDLIVVGQKIRLP